MKGIHFVKVDDHGHITNRTNVQVFYIPDKGIVYSISASFGEGMNFRESRSEADLDEAIKMSQGLVPNTQYRYGRAMEFEYGDAEVQEFEKIAEALANDTGLRDSYRDKVKTGIEKILDILDKTGSGRHIWEAEKVADSTVLREI